MIDWVHELAKEWGGYLRSIGNPYSSTNILHRMMREGIGAAHEYTSIPLDALDEDDSEPEVLSFHRAYLRLNEVSRDVIYVMYVPRAKIEHKIDVLKHRHGLSKSRIYEVRNQSHSQIWGFIDAHIQMRKLFPEKHHSGKTS